MTLLLDVPPVVALPRVRLVPAAVDSEGDLACDLSAGYGLTPFAWQRSALVDIMGVKPDGQWAASRVGLSVPRQNGKNGAAEIYELWVTSQLGMRVLHSAHEVKTARKAFKRLLGYFDNPRQHPELRDLVKEVRRTNGQEAIELHNGGAVEFLARTKSSGRGYSADILLMDEAQELTEDELEATLFAISASSNPQTFLMGTPPDEKKPATVWRRFRAAGALGTDTRLCWIEYSAGPDDDHAALSTWARTNPGAPVSIRWETIEDERGTTAPEGFARERLGVWVDSIVGSVFDLGAWEVLTDAKSHIDGIPVWAVDISPDRSRVSIGVCGRREDGLPHVEVVDNEPLHADGGVVRRLSDLAATHGGSGVVIDQGSAAGSLIPALTEAGLTVITAGSRDYAQACGAFYDAVTGATLRHQGPDQPELEAAVHGARQRPLGDAWAWDRKHPGTDITPLVAVTLALWGLAQTPDLEPSVVFI